MKFNIFRLKICGPIGLLFDNIRRQHIVMINLLLLQTTVDKALQQEIERLPVKCSFHAKGCDWTATFNELQV